jgi:hypothetical protein
MRQLSAPLRSLPVSDEDFLTVSCRFTSEKYQRPASGMSISKI